MTAALCALLVAVCGVLEIVGRRRDRRERAEADARYERWRAQLTRSLPPIAALLLSLQAPVPPPATYEAEAHAICEKAHAAADPWRFALALRAIVASAQADPELFYQRLAAACALLDEDRPDVRQAH